jgi:hypothetical protein
MRKFLKIVAWGVGIVVLLAVLFISDIQTSVPFVIFL